MNADGTNVVRLTNDSGYDYAAVWSPDATKIAWQSSRNAGQYDIFVMNANGTSQTNLTNNATAVDELPDWTPDGTRIAYDSNRVNGYRVWKIKPDGSDANNPTYLNSAIGAYGPSLSPDGKELTWAYARADAPPDNIARSFVDPNNTTLSFVTTSASVNSQFPDWQPLHNSYARPKAATPVFVPLVPAYKECTSPQTTHSGAISSPACYAPTPESSYLTVGSPDFNGAVANSLGSTKISLFCNGGAVGEAPPCLTTPGDQLDGKVTVSITDVRCQGTSTGCAGGKLTDYGNNLRFDTTFRITDKNNSPTGAGLSVNGTVVDLPLRFTVPCATTPSTSVGSTCSLTTSIDAAMGGTTAISEQKRAIWQVNGNIKLYDGGADGSASTAGDNTLFAVNGLFFP
jgi:hypothetical protein